MDKPSNMQNINEKDSYGETKLHEGIFEFFQKIFFKLLNYLKL